MPVFTVGTIDVGADNKLNLLAAINAQNGTTYTLDEYDFTDPVAITGIPTPQYNTSIKLGPKAATGMIGFKTIYYNRIHISEIGPLTIRYQNEHYLTELLPRLSDKYGIPLTVDDVYEQVILPPVAPATDISVTLNFKETSIAYYGGSFIVLGINDPALEFEIPETLPYKNDLIFYVNNYSKTKTDKYYLQSSLVGIALDRVRNRTISVTKSDSSSYVSMIKDSYTSDQIEKLKTFQPFVYSWDLGETKAIRGINIYGDVIEVNETADTVSYVTSLVNFDPLTSELDIVRSKIMVRDGSEDGSGNIYLLVGDIDNMTAKIMKSTDQGQTFNELTNLTKANSGAFNFELWENVIIHDFMVVGNKLSILVTNPVSYGTNPAKREFGPAVEEWNLITGAYNYFPINPEFVTNTPISLVFNNESKLRFVSPEDSPAILDVVAIGRTSKTLEPVIVYCNRQDGQEFEAEIVGTQYLDNEIYGLSAYSKPLAKDSTGKFVAIEFLSAVPTSEVNDFFIVEKAIKAEYSYMGYGVVCISGIRKGAKLGGWSENIVDIGGGSEPTSVTLTNDSQRNHYIFSGGKGIFNIIYTETEPNIYTPSLNKIFDTGSQLGFELECDIGNGAYTSPTVNENLTFAAIYNDFPNGESLKQAIDYSFIANNTVTNEHMWLTGNITDGLTERVFSDEYKHLGKMPIAVFTDSASKIYAWTALQGIYVSTDQGNSWSDYAAIKSYYSSDDYLCSALIPFRYEDIKAVSINGSITYAQVNPSRSLTVFNSKTLTEDFQLALDDNVIYKIDGNIPQGADEINGSYITTSLNSTSELSPRKVLAWDTDSANNIRALCTFNDGGIQNLNQLSIADSFTDTVDNVTSSIYDTIACYMDVGFLGLKAALLTYDGLNGTNLWLVKNDDSTVRHGLKFSPNPQYDQFDAVNFLPLWDASDTVLQYTPILITSTTNDVLVFERDGINGGDMTVNLISLVIPNDNSKPIEWIPMFNSNRDEFLIYQPSNGIYKLNYSWDPAGFQSQIDLTLLLSTVNLNIDKIYSGAQFNQNLATPFTEAIIGNWPPYGGILASDCQGYTKRNKLSDGYGGYFWKVVQTNSEDCGYVTPVPSDVGYGGGNVNIGP